MGEGQPYLFFLCCFRLPIFCSGIARAGAAAGPWRTLQKQAPVVAAGDGILPQEKRPAFLGLRAIEIVGLVVGVFMLMAAILAYLAFFYVTYRFRRH